MKLRVCFEIDGLAAVDLIGRIGKKQLLVSWYPTREEAESALKKREADNEKSNSDRL